MYLSDLYGPWHRGVVDRLRDAHNVLQVLADGDANSPLSAAEYHAGEALSLLTIGTEELHTLEGAGVGAYREVEE